LFLTDKDEVSAVSPSLSQINESNIIIHADYIVVTNFFTLFTLSINEGKARTIFSSQKVYCIAAQCTNVHILGLVPFWSISDTNQKTKFRILVKSI